MKPSTMTPAKPEPEKRPVATMIRKSVALQIAISVVFHTIFLGGCGALGAFAASCMVDARRAQSILEGQES